MRSPLLPIFAAAAALMLAAVSPCQARGTDGESRIISISAHTGSPVHQRVTLSVDKTAIVEIDNDARDVLVSNPEIVDAVVRTPRRIFLMAQKIGQTNAFFFDAGGRQIFVARHPRREGRDRSGRADQRRLAGRRMSKCRRWPTTSCSPVG